MAKHRHARAHAHGRSRGIRLAKRLRRWRAIRRAARST